MPLFCGYALGKHSYAYMRKKTFRCYVRDVRIIKFGVIMKIETDKEC